MHPYKSFEEQLKILEQEKGLIIDDVDLAMEAIQSFSYYSIINGYKDLFLKSSQAKETFVNGTTFSMLYTVHWMDIKISNILFKYTLAIEQKLKTQVSNLVAKMYSTDEDKYLDKRNYTPNPSVRGKLSEVRSGIREEKQRNVSIIHYVKNEGNVPPWIAVTGLSFGNTCNWYAILKKNDKKAVINSFFDRPLLLKDDDLLIFFSRTIGQVYKFRNLSAHGHRIFKMGLPEDCKQVWRILKKIKLEKYFSESNQPQNQNNLFSVMMSICLLCNDSFVIAEFLREIYYFFEEYSQDDYIFNGKSVYDLLDLDKNFFLRLKSYYENKFHTELNL